MSSLIVLPLPLSQLLRSRKWPQSPLWDRNSFALTIARAAKDRQSKRAQAAMSQVLVVAQGEEALKKREAGHTQSLSILRSRRLSYRRGAPHIRSDAYSCTFSPLISSSCTSTLRHIAIAPTCQALLHFEDSSETPHIFISSTSAGMMSNWAGYINR